MHCEVASSKAGSIMSGCRASKRAKNEERKRSKRTSERRSSDVTCRSGQRPSAASSFGTLSRRAPLGADRRRRPGQERLLLLRPKRQPSDTLQIRDASATDWGIIAVSARAPRDMLMGEKEKEREENRGRAQHSPSTSSARSLAPTSSSDAASRRVVGVASEFIPVLRPRFLNSGRGGPSDLGTGIRSLAAAAGSDRLTTRF
jgi:hypothetical protein